MKGPLASIAVLDLTNIYSGPICASILGDQGANVIKVEAPDGDPMRVPGRMSVNGVNGPFTMLNRNKRSLVLDLRNDSGKDVLRRLIPQVDVVIENFRPGVMERLGFGWDVLHALNEKLILATINGVGAEGPYSNRRVYDAVIQAISGLGALQKNPREGRPELVNTLICDKITAMTAAQNICAALHARNETGRGQHVETSMLDASLFFMWPDSMSNFHFVGKENPDGPHAGHSYFVRETKDGYIATMPVKRGEWQGLFDALELSNLLLDDPRFNTPLARQQNSAVFQKLLNDAYQKFETKELCERLDKNQVPYAEINTRDEVINDPQIVAMGALVEYEHNRGGMIRQPRPTGQFSETPGGLFRDSPALGEHSAEVLGEFGFDEQEIAGLFESAVISSSSD